MRTMGIRTYPTAWDTWIVVLLTAGCLTSIGATTAAATLDPSLSPGARVAVILVGLGAPFLMLVLLRKTEYTLTADTLVVRTGPFRWRIPYGEIDEVVPSRSLLSAPAGSLDRLAVKSRGKVRVLISPRRRRRFLDDLGARSPHLERRGDRLVGTAPRR